MSPIESFFIVVGHLDLQLSHFRVVILGHQGPVVQRIERPSPKG